MCNSGMSPCASEQKVCKRKCVKKIWLKSLSPSSLCVRVGECVCVCRLCIGNCQRHTAQQTAQNSQHSTQAKQSRAQSRAGSGRAHCAYRYEAIGLPESVPRHVINLSKAKQNRGLEFNCRADNWDKALATASTKMWHLLHHRRAHKYFL